MSKAFAVGSSPQTAAAQAPSTTSANGVNATACVASDAAKIIIVNLTNTVVDTSKEHQIVEITHLPLSQAILQIIIRSITPTGPSIATPGWKTLTYRFAVPGFSLRALSPGLAEVTVTQPEPSSPPSTAAVKSLAVPTWTITLTDDQRVDTSKAHQVIEITHLPLDKDLLEIVIRSITPAPSPTPCKDLKFRFAVVGLHMTIIVPGLVEAVVTQPDPNKSPKGHAKK